VSAAQESGNVIPSTPDSISPEWLTAALRGAGAVEYAKVVSIRVWSVATGREFAAESARLQIGYDRKESGAPSTVFVKLSAADRSLREKLRAMGIYETEVGFYRDVAVREALPMRVPRPYLSLYNATTGASILVIEDLSNARFGDNSAGCSPADARSAVRQLALVHAHFWESPELGEFKWLRSLVDDVESWSAVYRAVLPQFEKRWAEFLTPSLLKTARVFGDVLTGYFRQYSLAPHTLIHGDFRAHNLAFRSTSEGGGLVVFDWHTARRSPGALDLAYFLAGSMHAKQRRDTERSLVGMYYETLLACGVNDYSPDDLERDFRRGLGTLLATAVIAGAMLDFSNERGNLLIRPLLERLGAALEDHQFAGHLNDLAV
jgi:hypothetical protein